MYGAATVIGIGIRAGHFDGKFDLGETSMGGPIVRTGTTPEFWANWDSVFGEKKKKSAKKSPAKTAKAGAKKSAKKKAAKTRKK